VTQPNPDFTGLPATNSPGFSKPEFFDVLPKFALQNPPPLGQVLNASFLVLDGLIHQNQLTPDVVTQATNTVIDKLRATGTMQNGWSVDLHTGSYGTDYVERAAIAAVGLGANIPADAVYPRTAMDASGNQLLGTGSYVLHFAAGQTPPVHGFWSVTVYDENGFLVANSINRYNAGSETGLVPNADGSIDIRLQNAAPTTLQSNWLPIPATPFTLTLRLYWPDDSILNGTWTIPGVMPL
jgi:DNA sulfur modification protein DndE